LTLVSQQEHASVFDTKHGCLAQGAKLATDQLGRQRSRRRPAGKGEGEKEKDDRQATGGHGSMLPEAAGRLQTEEDQAVST
jgi:hypothetical protein